MQDEVVIRDKNECNNPGSSGNFIETKMSWATRMCLREMWAKIKPIADLKVSLSGETFTGCFKGVAAEEV